MEIEDDYSEKAKRVIPWKKVIGLVLMAISVVCFLGAFITVLITEEFVVVFLKLAAAAIISGIIFEIGHYLFKKD
jgi:hypothetical protein